MATSLFVDSNEALEDIVGAGEPGLLPRLLEPRYCEDNRTSPLTARSAPAGTYEASGGAGNAVRQRDKEA